jgi:hypothetical protein
MAPDVLGKQLKAQTIKSFKINKSSALRPTDFGLHARSRDSLHFLAGGFPPLIALFSISCDRSLTVLEFRFLNAEQKAKTLQNAEHRRENSLDGHVRAWIGPFVCLF